MSFHLRKLFLKPSTQLRAPIRHSSSTPSSTSSRISRILDRTPRFLHPYTTGLRNAPVSHITTFLLLHELTAILPLIGLSLYFHYTSTLPTISNSVYVQQGIDRFSRYFRRKEWFGMSASDTAVDSKEVMGEDRTEMSPGTIIVLEVATAYAVTKVLLPLRLLISIWATPATARIGLGAIGALGLRRLPKIPVSGMGKNGNGSWSAGTGATGGGVTSKR